MMEKKSISNEKNLKHGVSDHSIWIIIPDKYTAANCYQSDPCFNQIIREVAHIKNTTPRDLLSESDEGDVYQLPVSMCHNWIYLEMTYHKYIYVS